MGTRERREREKLRIRRQILDAARSLFVERGYESVTMREIAKRIEYSPTAIYLHFADKQAVMHALCEADFLRLAKQFRKIAEIVDPVERLCEAGRAYCAFGLKHPNHYRLMFMEPMRPPRPIDEHEIEKGNPDQDAYAFLQGTIAQAMAEGRLKPGLNDPEMVAQAVWAGVHGVVSLRIAKGSDPWIEWRPANEVSDFLCDSILNGILKDPVPSHGAAKVRKPAPRSARPKAR
jgi:AcrR family transcriptional regulator